jgi:hypothetical protein
MAPWKQTFTDRLFIVSITLKLYYIYRFEVKIFSPGGPPGFFPLPLFPDPPPKKIKNLVGPANAGR